MKNVTKVLVLVLISSVCALLIALVNYFTMPIIKENKEMREQSALEEIYACAVFTKEENTDERINGIWQAKVNDECVGYVYSISGKNAYGNVTVLFGINTSLEITKVILTENTESYSSKLEEHIKLAYSESVSDLEEIDLACGATFGAKLVKELLEIGQNDLKERLGQ